jgi:excisionase family DNA binding protein
MDKKEMTKAEAAQTLKVSTRAVERYTSKGKLNVSYRDKEGGGTIAVYDAAEVEKLKAEIENPPKTKPIKQPDTTTNGKALARVEVSRQMNPLLEVLAQVLQPTNKPNVMEAAQKLTLSLAEAAVLSGLSKGFLSTAIHSKKLKAAKRGRGWNVKRTDLDAYINKL